MEPLFLYNEAALLYKKALVIGDVHFGIEKRLMEKGIHDYGFSERLEKKIESLLDGTKAEKLIIAGDVKDEVAVVDDSTMAMVKALKEKTDVIIVKGNHDGGIEKCGVAVVDAAGFAYGQLGIFHGHSWPSEEVMGCKWIVSAHQHPQTEFRDKSGKMHFESCWVVAEADAAQIAKHYENFNHKSQLVLMPAFNPLVGSSLKKGEHLGPVLNNNLFKLNDALLFTMHGILIGKLKDLE
jgi:putative SbcD/Mre11-related phosphoesterase